MAAVRRPLAKSLTAGGQPNPFLISLCLVPGREAAHYLTKYQFSGLMLSVVDCGMTPRKLVVTSVSE
jgi:hypothetical protein